MIRAVDIPYARTAVLFLVSVSVIQLAIIFSVTGSLAPLSVAVLGGWLSSSLSHRVPRPEWIRPSLWGWLSVVLSLWCVYLFGQRLFPSSGINQALCFLAFSGSAFGPWMFWTLLDVYWTHFEYFAHQYMSVRATHITGGSHHGKRGRPEES